MTCDHGGSMILKRAKCGKDWIDFHHCGSCGRTEFVEAEIDGVMYAGAAAREAWQVLLNLDDKLDEVLQ